MRIALLAGANAKTCKDGPVVRLIKGVWLIHVHGLVDSFLILNVGGLTFDIWHGCEVSLPNHTDVNIMLYKRGCEGNITIVAERVRDAA